MTPTLVMVNARAYGLWTEAGDLACGINDATRHDNDCEQAAPYAVLEVRNGEPSTLWPLLGPYCRQHASEIVERNRQRRADEEERWVRSDRRVRGGRSL